METYGRLDAAFNNAGEGHRPAPLADIPVADFDLAIRVNARGIFLAMRAEIPAMLVSGGGAIVNMASTAGLRGVRGIAGYSAGKHAIIGLTEEHRPRLRRPQHPRQRPGPRPHPDRPPGVSPEAAREPIIHAVRWAASVGRRKWPPRRSGSAPRVPASSLARSSRIDRGPARGGRIGQTQPGGPMAGSLTPDGTPGRLGPRGAPA